MLLEFRVSNYRSIRDEQCLSLVPIGKDATLQATNIFMTGSESAPAALLGVGVYGANASGKSTVLNAMAFAQALIRDSASKVQAGQSLNVQGFAFDEAARSQPSSFEITVLVEGIRYQYGFSLLPERIRDEWLLVYKSSKPQEWFKRTWNEAAGRYDYAAFSSYFAGPKDLWKKSTRENALFLSTAVQLNSDQLKPLWDWLVLSWAIVPAQAGIGLDLTLDAIEKGGSKVAVLGFLNSADIGITDIAIERQQAKQNFFMLDGATGKASVSEPVDTEIRMPRFTHRGAGASAVIDFQFESQGTQRLFSLAGIVLAALDRGMALVIDEIESSMHPLLVRHILGLFLSPETNRTGAQIVFSTHSTSLMDNELLRRDQIWFTEKGGDQATVLVPLSDFSPRKKEAFAKGYLEGRYGAIPILGSPRVRRGVDAGE
jgi:AAA15 family ATPase/GTPase